MKHLPKTEATTKGHLDQIRKNIRSTKQQEAEEEEPTQEDQNEQTNQLFVAIEETGRIYTDQTGRFPVASSRSSKYIVVMYDYDTNTIQLGRPALMIKASRRRSSKDNI